MKTAIVYDRVNKWGGAERVLLSLHKIFPDAPLFCAVCDFNKAPWAKVFPKVIPSFLQKIPFLRKSHELLGWLTPLAFEQFDFSGFDLVISVTSEAAKGVITPPEIKHLCYCLTPTRYLWSGFEDYQKKPQWPLKVIPFYRIFSKPFLKYLQRWDKVAASRPDEIVAISKEVQERIKRYYQRKAPVVYPPLTINGGRENKKRTGGKYYLVVSRLVPYKKVNLAIRAFNRLGKKLLIVGEGSEEGRLKLMAHKNIDFVGKTTDQELVKLYRGAKALIFPQVEDFGLVSVEAQSFGVPVIAFSGGGVIETVIDGRTGLLFTKQNTDSLVAAVLKFEKKKYLAQDLISNAERFSEKVFKEKFLSIIEKRR